MSNTDPEILHRHKDSRGYWTKYTEGHAHAFTETAHPADALTAAEVTALRALLVPAPAPTPTPTPTPTPDPTPTLADDFTGLDPRWSAFYGPGDPGDRLDTDMMGNLSQVSVANGLCTMTAERKATPSGRPYAGAGMSTYGTFAQLYGVFEARFRYAAGQGVWPAFFLLPQGQHGPYPEIDVLEAYPAPVGVGNGSGIDTVVQAVHYAGETVSDYKAVTVANATTDFHVHRIVWTPSSVVFSIDGGVTFTETAHVPAVPMYPIFFWGLGAPAFRVDATTPVKLTMDIDYIRVWAS